MRKRLTMQASGKTDFKGYKCSHCGSTMLLASDSKAPHCAYCSAELEEGTSVSRAALTASPDKNLTYVKCVSCDSTFAVDGTEESAAELAASKYCPHCAGDALVACDKSGATIESSENDDTENDDMPDDLETETEGDDGAGFDGAGFDGAGFDGEGDENPESVLSELDASTHEDLQWSAVDTAEGPETAMIASSAHTGNPVAIFRQNCAPSDLQPLFAKPVFVSAFNEVASKDGLATAVKVFGGNYFSEKVLTAADIEKAALTSMKATAIPRIIDCCQIAVEGGAKGIYPEVFAALQRTLVNELVASGVDSSRASQAAVNALTIHGSDLLGTIMAKGMELFTKDDKARMEAKALISQASPVAALTASDQSIIRAAMEKPTPNFGIAELTASAASSKEGDDLKALRRQLF